ncbi:MAG: nicotinamide riboside transporter PnuC [Bacteroidota bacterium]
MLESFLSFSWIEQLALFSGIIYVVLAARESIWCWPWGILSSGLLGYASLTFYQLYADFGLQMYYVLMGFLGLYQWRFGSQSKTALPISRMRAREHLVVIVSGTIVGLFIGYFFDTYTEAAATYPDALTTSFSIIATLLVVQKKLENWLYWIVADLAYVVLYSSRGAWLFALLMVIYTGIAIFGYWQWKKRLNDHLKGAQVSL